MTDDPKNQPTNDTHLGNITRRNFGALLVGAGFAATVQSAAAIGLEMVETDVEIKTPDGTCDAAFIRPENRFPSGRADLARRIRLAALDARNSQAHCR